jgi:hypothetical protein
MIQRTGMCFLGILLASMLCMPAALAAGSYTDPGCLFTDHYIWDRCDYTGTWSFYLVSYITGKTVININGQGDQNGWTRDGYYQRVIVPDSLDKVNVTFVVTLGPDTTVTITKEYIEKLRKAKPNEAPMIYAWGGPWTYDVDACGGSAIDNGNVMNTYVLAVTTYEHLVKRGLVHNNDPDYQHVVDFNDQFYYRYVTA